MDKRFQVFISSTFEDLKDERQSVLKAVLELDNMPAGMELFPASDLDAWDLIKDVIDASDYYVLIIGGRYGSLDSMGLSYTEKEYEYALETKKPVIPLLNKNPDNLPRGKTETDSKAWNKLSSFRKKVEKAHTCVYWVTTDDLKSSLIIGLTKTIKRFPAIGWIRANLMPSENTLKEIIDLRKKNGDLEEQIKKKSSSAPEGTEDLYQGEDELALKCSFIARNQSYERTSYTGNLSQTWNEIWSTLSPTLINEASKEEIFLSLKKSFSKLAKETWEDKGDLKNSTLTTINFESEIFDTIIIQFRALGLIEESIKQRSIKDTKTYWALTSYGDNLMMQLRALRKTVKKKRKTSGKTKIED